MQNYCSYWNVHIFDALNTLRVYVPTLVSKGVIAIFQYVLPWKKLANLLAFVMHELTDATIIEGCILEW